MQSIESHELRIAAAPLAVSAPATTGVLSPLSRSSASASFLPPAPAVAGGERSLPPILVADDDEDDRYFIRRLITKTGTPNPLRVFDDGSEVANYLGSFSSASPEVRARAPRLLFLDLRMNGLGGFGFLEWARQQKSALPMTIVVLSNSAEPEDMHRALELGAHRYLVKYPSVQTFSTIIRSVYPFSVAATA
jgi:CheY-like chemotaxis protein